jgi:hypothetical protein
MRTRHSLGGLMLATLLLACESPVAQLTDGGTSNGGTGGTGGPVNSGTSGSGGATSASSGNGSSGGASTSGSAGATTSGTAGTSTGTSGGTTGGLLNQPCSVNNGIDPCVAVGLVCMLSTDPAHTGTVCSLPGEFSPCQAAVGCADDSLQCQLFATGAYCLRPCTVTDNCPTLYTTCQPAGSGNVCYFDLCMVTGDGGTFSPCDAVGQGDGTCLPTTGSGICLQSGTAVPGDLCSDHRGPGITLADLCVQNAFCIPGGVAGAAHCAPLCGTLDGGTNCPSPTFCQPSGSGDWGYCL